MGIGSGSVKIEDSKTEQLSAKQLDDLLKNEIIQAREKELIEELKEHNYRECKTDNCTPCKMAETPYKWGRADQYNLTVADLKRRGLIT